MKRSRAFVLSEQLMTIMLQAGFILVLCTSFYQLISFYTRTQQVLTARNHAERVISFMDDKIRSAGLGLWKCKNSSDIRSRFEVTMLATQGASNQGYRLPIALQNGFRHKGTQNEEVIPQTALGTDYIPLLSLRQDSGNVLTLLYAQRSLSSGAEETISAFRASQTFNTNETAALKLLDSNDSNPEKVKSLFKTTNTENPEYDIKTYAVMEGFGFPIHLEGVTVKGGNRGNRGEVQVKVYGTQPAQSITIPAAGELLSLNCMQMFVHTHEGERQFAFRELKASGTWDNTYNQEKGVLDIYMEVDKDHRVFTLWVLASGGYDASLNNPRPETWPEQAQPTATQWGKKVSDIRDYTSYPHHIVYVSRASWKLNNIPPNFVW